MGTLEYVNAEHSVEIDDRTLAHLQIVICSKLRRGERFTLRVTAGDGVDGPVRVLWMTPTIPILFTYSTPTGHVINPGWLHLLADAAASNAGLSIVPEPAPESAASGSDRSRRETSLAQVS